MKGVDAGWKSLREWLRGLYTKTSQTAIQFVMHRLADTFIPGLSEGEKIIAMGEWKNHPEYGQQFSVSEFERVMPKTENEIELYLGSGILPHVGKSTARKMVELFGEDALRMIENEPQRLTEIKGISRAKAEEIHKRYVEQIGIKNIVVFFQQFGVSPNLAVKAYRTFGQGVVSLAGENPFALSGIDGFTFKICDRIREEMKLPPTFEPRICAGVVSTLLNGAYLSGHTYLPKGQLVAQTKAMLEIDATAVEDAISKLSLEGTLKIISYEEYLV